MSTDRDGERAPDRIERRGFLGGATSIAMVGGLAAGYGTFAALPIFLFWLYVCWTVILGGANLVRCLPHYPRQV